MDVVCATQEKPSLTREIGPKMERSVLRGMSTLSFVVFNYVTRISLTPQEKSPGTIEYHSNVTNNSNTNARTQVHLGLWMNVHLHVETGTDASTLFSDSI